MTPLVVPGLMVRRVVLQAAFPRAPRPAELQQVAQSQAGSLLARRQVAVAGLVESSVVAPPLVDSQAWGPLALGLGLPRGLSPDPARLFAQVERSQWAEARALGPGPPR